jgi:hypothetical protein
VSGTRERVPVSELLDVARLGRDGRPPTPRELRAALPRGWALDDDGLHAHRDLRLFFREGYVLVLGLLIFGALGAFFLIDAAPRGLAGMLRLAALVGLVLVLGGLAGPLVTRALQRRR